MNTLTIHGILFVLIVLAFFVSSWSDARIPTSIPKPPAPPPQNLKNNREIASWLDMDAEYFVLEDPKRTPLKIVSIKSGVVRLESDSMSHCYTCHIDDMHKLVTIIK